MFLLASAVRSVGAIIRQRRTEDGASRQQDTFLLRLRFRSVEAIIRPKTAYRVSKDVHGRCPQFD